MHSRARAAVGPVYLLLCLILGGSVQGIWSNLLLQLIGIGLIGWAAAERSVEPMGGSSKKLLIIAIAGVVVVALQLVPLPPGVWASLGPRQAIAANYRLLGLPLPWLPISLTPSQSLDTLLRLIPALAMVCVMLRLKAYRPSWMAAALLAGALAGVLLGALQVASSAGGSSRWYPYEETNVGFATGFFANANHMAILLAITLPFLAASVAEARAQSKQRYYGIVLASCGVALVIVVGIILNRSLAAYGLGIPIAVASIALLLPSKSRLRPWLASGGALLLVGGVAMLATSSIGARQLGAATSVQSREEILVTTAKAVGAFFPWGSGLGSFPKVYNLYEDHQSVTNIVVVHVHDDYVELALETGAAGIVLMLVFLAWWLTAVLGLLRSAEPRRFARAAAIASAAVLLHSLVDFPLRTAAVSTCFAMCLCLLSGRPRPPRATFADLRASRHVRIGD